MLKKILLFFGLVCFLGNPVFAENFYIDNYDVKMKVNNDKSINVVETIDTYFTISSHGIYRTIPLDGNKISDIFTSDNSDITYNRNGVYIKLGDPDRYVSGKKSYRISYTYTITDNKNDEFYFNIIGTNWNVPINRASFDVTMPKNFDSTKVGLSIGKYGTAGFNGNAELYVNGNNIVGHTTQKLHPGEGITLRIELPRNYFINLGLFKKYFLIAIILLLTGFSYLLWFKVGKDNPITPVVTFYPPDNINSIEAEAIYLEGNPTNKGITSLIVYLASKGYLKIIDKKHFFTLEKIKEYDGDNPIEKEFFKALFTGKTSVNSYELLCSKEFYKKCQEIMTQTLDLTYNKLYEKFSVSTSAFKISLMLLILIIVLTFFILANFDLLLIIRIFIPLIFLIIAISVLCINKEKDFGLIIWALGFGGIPLILIITQLSEIKNITLQEALIYIACIIICIVCLKNLPKRNRHGEEILGKLKGLKKFIEVTEKHRLQKLANENPEYFYDVLPFAYIFGISDVWIKKFESIMEFSPDWCTGQSFSVNTFNSLTKSINQISEPSISNGGISKSSSGGFSSGGSGGGGFSGGGCGGGGGGSW